MTPARPLKLALLGTGGIATRAFAPALAKMQSATLWSVLSRDLDRAKAFAGAHGAGSPTPAYDDLAALVSDPELDGVVITTPDRLHAEQAQIAAEAGKHVLVEKPMATNSADARAMIDVAQAAGVTLGVAYHLRWHAGHQAMHSRVRGGELGELRHVRVQWAWPAPDDSNWRARPDVGRWWSLAGVGTHCLDLIRWFLMPAAGEVAALESLVSHSVWGGPHDETAVVSMHFDEGATAVLTSSVLYAAPSRLEVYGSSGYLIATGTLGGHGRGRIEGIRGDVPFTPVDPYVGELEDFVAAVEEGRDPEVSGPEGLRNVELLEWACP